MNTRLKVGTILAGAALAATALFGGAAAAAGTNLVQNGSLKTNTNGWMFGGPGTFTSEPGVGGKLLDTEESKKSSVVVAYQCVTLPSRAHHQLEARIQVLPDQKRSGSAWIAVSYHSDPICWNEGVVDSYETPHFSEADGWHDISMELHRTNGAEARSMSVRLMVIKNDTKRMLFYKKPFGALFADVSVVALPEVEPESPPPACDETGCGPKCLIGFDCEEESDGPVVGCAIGTDGCPEEPAEPAGPVCFFATCGDDEPAPPAPADPVTLEPLGPSIDPEPDFPLPPGDEPADSDEPMGSDDPATDDEPATPGNDDKPAAPSGPASNPKPAGQGGSQQPANSQGDAQGAGEGEPAAPAKPGQPKPTTQAPAAPATGDSDRIPAGNGEDTGNAAADGASQDSAARSLPLVGGGLAALATLFIAGLLFKRASRKEDAEA